MRDLKTPKAAPLDLVVLRGWLRLEEDRAASAPLLKALRAGERTWRELSKEEQDQIFGAPLVDLLLEQSFALRYADPSRMVCLAELARAVVEGIPARRYGRKILANLTARAWAELGNAYRVADDLYCAEYALTQAAGWARCGTRDPRLLARLADLLGSLLSDNRDFAKAIEALEAVRSTYEELGEHHLVGRALVSMGLYTGYKDEPERAVVLLTQAWQSLEPGKDPDLERSAFDAMVLNLAEAGLFPEAKSLLAERKRVFGRDRNGLTKLRVRWIEGKISFGLKDLAWAEACFHLAKMGFKKAQQTYDAALVGLDLSLLFVEQGRRRETGHLVEEMVATFRSLGIAREAIASLLVLRKSCMKSATPKDTLRGQIQAITALIKELQSRPNRSVVVS